MVSQTYAAYLEQVRVTHHIRIKALCDYVGFSEKTYQRIVRDEASPKIGEFCRWLDFLHVDVAKPLAPLIEAAYFRITPLQNRALTLLRDPAPLPDAGSLRRQLTALAEATHQPDCTLLMMLLKIRETPVAARPAIARTVLATLQRRKFWAAFELQSFLVIAPYLTFAQVDHAMERYAQAPAKGQPTGPLIGQVIHYQEALLLCYVQAACATHICENVIRALTWGTVRDPGEWTQPYDFQVLAALCQALVPVFEASRVKIESLDAVFAPRLAALTKLNGPAPSRLAGRIAALAAILKATSGYHHDARPRHCATPTASAKALAAGFGERLDQLRRAQRVSIKNLCRLSGLTRDGYANALAGAGLRLDQLCRALDCLHVGLHEFITWRDMPYWAEAMTLSQSRMAAAARGELAADHQETLARFKVLAAGDSPYFTMMVQLMRTIDAEIGAGFDAALPIGQKVTDKLASFDAWTPRDYYLLADTAPAANLATAQRLMRQLAKAQTTPDAAVNAMHPAVWPNLWYSLLTVAYRTRDADTVLAMTRTIVALPPLAPTADTTLWDAMQCYAAYVAQVVTQGRTAAEPAWRDLMAAAKTLLPTTTTTAAACINPGPNRELLLAVQWPGDAGSSHQ
ncbi:hypothetical protein [Lacticaseibacillus suihuaensis]